MLNPEEKKKLYTERVFKEDLIEIFKRKNLDDIFTFLSNNYTKDILQKLGGVGALEILERDPEVSSAIEKRKAALLNTKVIIEHENESVRKFFSDQILPWQDDLTEAFFSGVEYGFGVLQVIYKEDKSCRVEGYRNEDPWAFEPQEDLIHLKLKGKKELLPFGKWILTTVNAKASRPQGMGLYERLLIPHLMLKQNSELWQIYNRRFAGGFLLARRETDDQDVLDAIRESLDRAEKLGSIVTNTENEITSLGTSGDANSFFNRETLLQKSIQKVVLGETQTTDSGIRGSSFSASIHNDVRWEKTASDILVVKRSYQMLVNQLAAVCGARPDQIPTVKVVLDQGVDSEKLDGDQKLFSLGVRFNKKYFINNYGLEDGEFDVADLTVPQNPLGGLFGNKTFSSGPKKFKSVDPEEISELGLDTFDLPIDNDDLMAAILSSENKKDLEEKLLALYDNTDLEFIENFAAMLYAGAASGALKGIPVNKKIEPLPEDEQDEFL